MIKTTNYTITKGSLPVHELIGLDVKVVSSTDANKKGITGTVVDETQRTFTIETSKGDKVVPKHESIFSFRLGSEQVEVVGNTIQANPIERLKNGGKNYA